MDAVAELALEPVAVEQRHEQLEVLFLAVVRRGGHQQEVAREAREELAQPVALRVADLAAEEGGRELVGLVDHDQVVAAVRGAQLRLHVLVAGQLVQARDGEVVLEEPVAGAGGFELVVRHDLERQVEPPAELVLPLLDEAAGADDEASAEVAPRDQLLDEEAGHDRLAGARIVREQEAQRLAREHLLVDRRDLVRERVHERGVDREHGIEQVGEADAVAPPRRGGTGRRRRRSSTAGRPRRSRGAARRGGRGSRRRRVRSARDTRASARPSRATQRSSTVTRASGRMPRTVASGWRSSSFMGSSPGSRSRHARPGARSLAVAEGGA